MSSNYARMRSTEAPMSGIEFTNRSKTIPAWRVDHNTPLKRTHSDANPPPSPFDPKRNSDSKPIFGDNVKFLFSPQVSTPGHRPYGSAALMQLTPDTPDIVMNEAEASPSPPPQRRNKQEHEDEQAESPEVRPMSNVAVRRVGRARLRAQERSLSARRRARFVDEDDSEADDDSGDDDGSPRRPTRLARTTSNHYTLNMPGHVAPKSDTPYILLGYLQFLFNLSLILVFLYLLLQFILTVQRDVEQRISEYSMEILQDISTCTTLYKTNLCDTNPIPAMTHQCAAWETCMNRDPKVIGRAKVSAEMLAEVVNSFVEPISWKTLAFTLTSLSFMTVFVNTLISLYRSRHRKGSQQPDAGAQLPLAPGQAHFAPLTPFHPHAHAYGYLPPVPAPWHPAAEVEQTPSRRRRLENGEKVAVQ